MKMWRVKAKGEHRIVDLGKWSGDSERKIRQKAKDIYGEKTFYVERIDK